MRSERGQSLVLLVAALLGIVLGGLVLGGVARGIGARSDAQKAADLAALAGARAMLDAYPRLFVQAEDESHLDSWEGADTGLYRKLRMRVHTLDRDVLAWVYVLDAFEGGLPSARYLGVLAEAAERAGAPADYVTQLRMRPCRKAWP